VGAVLFSHVEPALAFQLELFRMSGFDVKASVLESRSLHLYYGAARLLSWSPAQRTGGAGKGADRVAARASTGTGKHNPADGRFFVRGGSSFCGCTPPRPCLARIPCC
jgi:hypothetical protein